MPTLPLPKQFHPDFATPNRQPIGEVEVDKSNSLSKGLTDFLLPHGNSVIDVVSNRNWIATVNPSNGLMAMNRFGRYIDCINGDHEATIRSKTFTTNDPWSVTWLASKTTAGADNGMFITNNDLGFIWMRSDGSEMQLRNSSGAESVTLDIASITHDQHIWRTITYDGNDGNFAYYAGGLSDTGAQENSGSYVWDTLFGGWSVASEFGLVGDFQGLMIHDKELSKSEAEELHKNPYQILKPKQPPMYFVSGEITLGWTGTINGVLNPAKINGILVANISKVNGVASS